MENFNRSLLDSSVYCCEFKENGLLFISNPRNIEPCHTPTYDKNYYDSRTSNANSWIESSLVLPQPWLFEGRAETRLPSSVKIWVWFNNCRVDVVEAPCNGCSWKFQGLLREWKGSRTADRDDRQELMRLVSGIASLRTGFHGHSITFNNQWNQLGGKESRSLLWHRSIAS